MSLNRRVKHFAATPRAPKTAPQKGVKKMKRKIKIKKDLSVPYPVRTTSLGIGIK